MWALGPNVKTRHCGDDFLLAHCFYLWVSAPQLLPRQTVGDCVRHVVLSTGGVLKSLSVAQNRSWIASREIGVRIELSLKKQKYVTYDLHSLE